MADSAILGVPFATIGDLVVRRSVLSCKTTNGTTREAFLDGDGGAQRLVMPDNTTWRLRITAVARRTDNTADQAIWSGTGALFRGVGAASVAVVGLGITMTQDASAGGAGGWALTPAADTTNGGLKVTVGGEAAKTIQWVILIETIETTG